MRLKIFNQYGEGGYLAYTLSSHNDKVFIFGDAALMGDQMLYTYADVETVTPNWDSIIRRFGTDIVLYDVNTPLADVMDHAADWTKVYQDGLSVAFVPNGLDAAAPASAALGAGQRLREADDGRAERGSAEPVKRPDLLVIADPAAQRHAIASRIAWIAAAAIVVLVLTVQPFSNTDVWWHLALGRLITTSGIPAHEPFSFLPAAHVWVGQQWLYEVTLAGLVGAGGADLVSLVMGLAAVAAVVLATLSVPRAGRISGPWLALAMVITGVVLNSVAGVSSGVISVLGVAIVLFVISRWREGRTAAVWGLPPLFLLWANMDAGFAAGLLIVLAALLLIRTSAGHASGSRRQLGAALAISAVAALANPVGPGLYGSVISGIFNPGVAQALAGFGSPDFHEWWARLFEAEVVLVVVLWTISGGPDRFSAVTAFGLLIATLFAQENLGLLAVARGAAIGTSRGKSVVAPRGAATGSAPATPPRPGISIQRSPASRSSRWRPR